MLHMPNVISVATNFISYNLIFTRIAVILPIIICAVLYLTFLRKEKAATYTGLAKQLYDFLTFKTFSFKKVLEVLYLFLALYVTIYGALLLFVSPVNGLTYLIINNLILRLVFEFFMIIYKVKENTENISSFFGEKDYEVYVDEEDDEDEELSEENEASKATDEKADEADEEKE